MSKTMMAGRKLLAAFRTGARTVGLSPKALAGGLGAAVTALAAAAGLTPEVIGHAIGVSPTVVAAAEVTIVAKIAAWLLPPGQVLPAPMVTSPASDAVNEQAFAEHPEATAPPAPAAAAA